MRRSNPSPAFVDLFSALLIAAFGGLMLLSAAYKSRVDQEVIASDVRHAADAIHKRLRMAIAGRQTLRARTRDCGDDTCIDLYIHFAVNKDTIADPVEKLALRDLGVDLRRGLDELPELDRRDVEVIVEGHADRTPVTQIGDQRHAFLFNWNLSAQRASSVVYEFRSIGLHVPEYKV